MPGFVADEYAEAFTLPMMTIGGVPYLGVLVSADEWFAIAPRIERAQTDSASRAELQALVRDMTDLCFPRKWWKVWERRVSTRLRTLPWGAQLEALGSFTVAQALAQHGRPGRMEPATDGTTSPG